MSNLGTLVSVKTDKLGRYETVGEILSDIVHAACSVLEQKLKEDLSDDAVTLESVKVKVEERIDLTEDYGSPSVNEADIEKKIKDLRRISENQIADIGKDRIESGIGETYFSPDSSRSSTNSVQSCSDMNNQCMDTFDETASVDMEDRHWKRRHRKSMKRTLESPLSEFSISNIHVSPVIKQSRITEFFSDASISFADASCPVSLSSVGSSSTLLSSTPSLAAFTPWSVTESAPQIFWSDVKGLDKIDETSEDATCLKDIIKDQEFEEKVDLREILKHRKCSRSSSSVVGESVSGIDRTRVTVGKGTGVRRIEGDVDSDVHENELEEGEIMNSSGSVKSKEINSKYNKNLLSDLLEKKKLLEHLIHIVNREESGQDETKVSLDKVSSESSTSDDDAIEEPSSRRVVEELSRRVVYRSSPMAEDQTTNVILNDFNSEMDKGLRNVFQRKHKIPSPQVSIKIEPASDDETKHVNVIPATAKQSSKRIYVSKSAGKFECNLCDVTCLSQRSMKEHMMGKKHQLNLMMGKKHQLNLDSLHIVKSEPKDIRLSPKHGHVDITVINKTLRKKIIWDLK